MATETWNGTSGDWATGTLWSGGTAPGTADTAILATSDTYLATIGTSTTTPEFDIVANATLDDPHATLQITTNATLDATSVFSLAAGALTLAGTLAAGTLQGGAGTIELGYYAPGTLRGGTIAQTVTVGGDGTLDLIGAQFATGATLLMDTYASTLDVSGGLGLVAGAAIAFESSYNDLQFTDGETVAGGTIILASTGDELTTGAAPVTLGAATTLEIQSYDSLVGTFVDSGLIAVAPEVNFSLVGAALTDTGSIALGTGAEITLGSIAAGTLANLIAHTGFGQSALFSIDGTLDNTGATLDLSGPLASELQLYSATLLNGVLIPGTAALSFATLANVTVDGPLTLYNTTTVRGGLTLTGAGGIGAGALTLTEGGGLAYQGAATLDNVAVVATGYETVSDTAAFTLGGGADVAVRQGSMTFSAPTLVNDGTITIARGAVATFKFSGDNFVNNGVIDVAPGGTVAISGTLTPAELAAIIGGMQGVDTVVVGGTILDTTVFDPPQPVLLAADIEGGTVVNSGSLQIAGAATLDNVTFQGVANLGTGFDTILALRGSDSFETAAGAPGGTIVMGGEFQTLAVLGGETLDSALLLANGIDDVLITTASTLAIGAGFTIAASAQIALSGATIVTAGQLVTVGTGALALDSATIVNDGTIAVGPGGMLGLGLSQYGSGVYASLDVTGSGTIELASGATLALGANETTQQLLTLLGTQTGLAVTLQAGTLTNATTGLVAGPGAQITRLTLVNTVLGGSIVNLGGVQVTDAILNDVTFDGPLNLTSNYSEVTFLDGFDVQTGAGTGTGAVTLSGYSNHLTVADATPLNTALVILSGQDDAIATDLSTLTLGSGLTVDATGIGETIQGTTIATAATLSVADGASLALDSTTIVNTGSITVAAGGTLGLGLGYDAYGTLSLTGTGALSIAPGATLVLGGTLTTASLEALVSADPGITIEIQGTLINTGTSLPIGSGDLTNVILDGSVVGGTIAASPSLTILGGTLSGVTVDGPLLLTQEDVELTLVGATLDTAAGAPGGSIVLDGYDDTLAIAGTASTFDNATIALADITDTVSATTTLTLGANAAVLASGSGIISAPALVNAGTMMATGTGALLLELSTIFNTGMIGAVAGATLGLGLGVYGSSVPGPLALTGPGGGAFALDLASGATLDLGATITTAQLDGLLGTTTGVTVEAFGELVNSGQTLTTTSSGTLSHLVLAGDLLGGTLANAGGTLSIGSGTFDGVTVIGPLELGSSNGYAGLQLRDGLTLLPASGSGPGTIALQGYEASLVFDNVPTLADAFLATGTSALTLQSETGTLAIAAGTTLAATSPLLLSAATITNAGTLIATGTKALVTFGGGTIDNSGSIVIGGGAGLALDVANGVGLADRLDLVNSELLTIAQGGTLIVGATETTAQLLALLGTLAGTGVTVEVEGTLDNRGTALDVTAAGSLTNLILDADVIGGSIVDAGGTITVAGGTFDDVTYVGTLTLSSNLAIADGLTVQNPDGSPGTIVPTAYGAALTILDGTTLDRLSIDVSSQAGGFSLYGDTGTLALGAGLTISTAAATAFIADTIASAATIVTMPATGYGFPSSVSFEADTIINTGSVDIIAGAGLGLDNGDTLSGSTLDVINDVANGGSFALAAGASLVGGGEESTGQLLTLLAGIGQASADVTLGGLLENGGTTLTLAPGLLGTVVLAGTIDGGTLANAGAAITYSRADLRNVTVLGPLDLATTSAVLTIDGSFALSGTNGIGTIDLANNYQDLTFDSAQSLDNVVILSPGLGNEIAAGALTLGPDAVVSVTGGLTVGSTNYYEPSATIANEGTIDVAAGADFTLDVQTFINTGLISVGLGGLLNLDLAASNGATLPFTSSGSIELANGAIVEVGGTETTAQLLLLLGSISHPGVITYLNGTLINTGAVLATSSSGLIDVLEMAETVIGGTIDNGSGALSLYGGTLAGVTFQGNLVIASGNETIVGGTIVANPTGAQPGTVELEGRGAALTFADSGTLANLALSVSGSEDTINAGSATLIASSNISVSGSGAFIEFGSLTLAPSVGLAVTGGVDLDGAVLVNDTTIAVTGAGAVLDLQAGTLVNDGVINVAAGAVLDVDSLYGAPIDLTGTGSINLAPGATLEVGGVETTAQLVGLIGSIVGTQTGVALGVTGTIDNAGATLTVAPGPLAGLVSDATIIGGTVANDGGSLFVSGGTFESLAFVGPLVLQGTQGALFVDGALTVDPLSGTGPGTLVTGGSHFHLVVTGTAGSTDTLDNLFITGDGGSLAIQMFDPYDNPLSSGTLLLTSSVTAAVNGVFAIDAPTIVNEGTILLTTPGDALGLETDDLINYGTIIVGPGAAFGFGGLDSVSLTNNNLIEIESGASIGVGGSLTTGQFEGLISSLVTVSNVLVAFGDGVLDNTNATLAIPATGSLSAMALGGAEIFGGSILNAGTLAFAEFNELQNVAFSGPITLALPDTSLEFLGSSTLVAPASGQSIIEVVGTEDSLSFAPGAALSEAFPAPPTATSQEIDNALILVGMPGSAYLQDSLGFGGGGTVTLGATSTIALGTGAYVTAAPGAAGNTTVVNDGTIVTLGTEVSIAAEHYSLALAQYGLPTGDGIIVNDGVIAIASAMTPAGPQTQLAGLSGSIINAGMIFVQGPGSLELDGSSGFLNTGIIALSGSADLSVSGTAVSLGRVSLADGAEAVLSNATGVLSGTLANFDNNDVLDLQDIPYAGTLAVSETFSAGVLDVFQGTTLVAALTLPTYAYASTDFSLGADRAGGTRITTDITSSSPPPPPPPPPCFAAGTRIRTEKGPVAVEDLAAGSLVSTRDGARSVLWIGQREVDCRRHPHPERVQPIRVCRSAFGRDLPSRDLLLSPDHALFVDGVLIPVQHLLNGATIRREQVAHVRYFHVELSAHDILFAEDLPAESYLDTGNRSAFANGGPAMSLHPDFFPRGWAEACAPLCQSGPVVDAVRNRLLARARRSGYRLHLPDAPVLQVGTRTIAPSAVTGQLHRYLLPAGATSVRICSGAGIPAVLDGDAADCRPLGVAIGGILLDGRPIALDSALLVSGFWPPETRRGKTWRWTDGHAELDLPPGASPRVLELWVTETMPQLRKPARRQA